MAVEPAKNETTQFHFEGCLGAGGFGEVYLARMTTQSGLERQVAVKLLHGSVDQSAVRRLRDEARLLAALNHRAILQVHDLLQVEERTALVTEYIEGQDLSSLVDLGGLAPRCAVEIVGEVAGALNAALTAPAPGSGEPLGLVHRDIKPGNIRIARSGGVKLLDFGIAVSKVVTREAKTGTGLVIGTLGFLAPERLSAEAISPPSDIYALGCVLFEALAGEGILEGVSQQQMLRQALIQAHHDAFMTKRIDGLPAGVPAEVRDLVRRMVAYEADDRPTAAGLERECDELAHGLPGPHLRRWARERDWPKVVYTEGTLAGLKLEARSGTTATPAAGATMDFSLVGPVTQAEALSPVTGMTGSSPVTGITGLSPAPPAPSRARTRVAAGIGVLAILGVASAVVWQLGTTHEVAGTPPVDGLATAPSADPGPSPTPVTPPVAAPAPVEAVTPTPQPVVPVVPVATVKPTSAERAAPPKPSTTAQAPTPAPAVAEPTVQPTLAGPSVVSVGVRGDAMSVSATLGGDTRTLPSSLTPGTWRVRATFASGELWTSELSISRDGTIDCSAARAKCTLR